MKIEDGTGLGFQAKVNNRNELETVAVTRPEEKLNNIEGNTWTIVQSTTPVGANDYLFYFENTGSKTYVVTEVDAWCGAASVLWIVKAAGTPTFTAGVDLTPAPKNLGSSASVTATIKEDTNTTGITDDGKLASIVCDAANKMETGIYPANIIIPPGQKLAMYTEGTAAVNTVWTFTILDQAL